MVSTVVIGRVAFSLLALTTLVTVIYTCSTDGSPFRWVVLTPWMAATLIDFYANVAVIATWVCYKEETWLGKIFWTLMLICFGSMATGVYLVVQLFKLSPSDPFHLVLLRETHAKYVGQPVANNTKQPVHMTSFSQWLK